MISTSKDDWLNDQFERFARWIVELSNGETAFQDDRRPGLAEPSGWKRLKEYCYQNNLFIKSMRLQFRSHVEHVDSEADGFFFCKSITSGLGAGITNSYLTGTVRDAILTVRKWQVPELIRRPFLDDSMEQIRDIEKSKDCLILKPTI